MNMPVLAIILALFVAIIFVAIYTLWYLFLIGAGIVGGTWLVLISIDIYKNRDKYKEKIAKMMK
jgi:hypothetical protein